MARPKVEDKPKFTVQVNVVMTVHADDEMAAVTTVIREVEGMIIRGCLARKIKYFSAKQEG